MRDLTKYHGRSIIQMNKSKTNVVSNSEEDQKRSRRSKDNDTDKRDDAATAPKERRSRRSDRQDVETERRDNHERSNERNQQVVELTSSRKQEANEQSVTRKHREKQDDNAPKPASAPKRKRTEKKPRQKQSLGDYNSSLAYVLGKDDPTLKENCSKMGVEFAVAYRRFEEQKNLLLQVSRAICKTVKDLKDSHTRDAKKANKNNKRKKNGKGGFPREYLPNEKLSKFLGIDQTQTVKIPYASQLAWRAFRSKNLLKKGNKRIFIVDDEVEEAFNISKKCNEITNYKSKDGFNFCTLQKNLIRNMTPIATAKETANSAEKLVNESAELENEVVAK